MNKIIDLFTLILKITRSSNKLAASKNNGSKLTFEKKNNNDEVNVFNINSNNIEYVKKSIKLKS